MSEFPAEFVQLIQTTKKKINVTKNTKTFLLLFPSIKLIDPSKNSIKIFALVYKDKGK